MRIAFFGGSFDPPHLAHLAIARAAVARLQLDRVLLAPAGRQPFKQAGAPSSYVDRLAMARLMLGQYDERAMVVSEMDAPRSDGLPNYTYDTVKRLRDSLDAGDELFFLVGADSFLSLHSWHCSAELLPLANWIVAGRPGFDLGLLESALPPGFTLASGSSAILNGREDAASQSPRLYTEQIESESGRVCSLHVMPDLQEDISATWVRSSLAEGVEELPVLATSVADYIRIHGLYRDRQQR